ncbi:MAG: PqqD family protein [Gammaproteobacteria bacterium]|nr:PqqD family protein [Gammaproteobacteria bacterium]
MNHTRSLIGRDPQVCYTQINPDEIVILNPVEETFYHLNESAVDLWLSLETPKTLLELAQMLAEKYSGHSEKYQQDVIEWVEETQQQGLLINIDQTNASMDD